MQPGRLVLPAAGNLLFGIKGKGLSFFNDLQGKTTNLISRLVYEKLQ
jgi:hypothetical protein